MLARLWHFLMAPIRRAPQREAGPATRRAFTSEAGEYRLMFFTGIDSTILQRGLRELANESYRDSPLYQPGYAGWGPSNRQRNRRVIVLGVSPQLPGSLHRAVVVHELLHFARHQSGEMPFEPSEGQYTNWEIIAEEGTVWILAYQYAQGPTTLLGILYLAVLAMLAGPIYSLLYWLLIVRGTGWQDWPAGWIVPGQ